MTSRAVAIILIAVGLVVNQYGFLNDMVWAKHAGAIYMGPRTYALVVAGLVAVIAGVVLLWSRGGR